MVARVVVEPYALELVGNPGLTMTVYTPEPGTKSDEALNLLGSWTATPDPVEADVAREEQPRDSRRS